MTPEPAPSAPTAAVKRRVLLVAVLGATIVFLDSSIATLALPAIQRDLGLSTAMQQWVASAYLLTLSVLLLVGGRLSDLFGRRRMFLTGLAAYAVLATLAGLSPNGGVLIAVRAVQGVAGAMLVPTTLALINATFPPNERGVAIGRWAAYSGVATILGPFLGGLVIEHASWRLAFLFTPAIAIVALLLGRAMPESRDETATRHIDALGVALLVLGVGGPVLALIQGPVAGWGSPIVWGGAVLGVVFLPLFVLWERRATEPMLPLEMFADRDLSAANAVTLFVYAGLYGSQFYVSLYLQSALGISPAYAGAVFVPSVVLLFLLSPYAGRLNDRFGPRWLMTFGPLVGALGIAVAGFTRSGQVLTVLIPGLLLFGVGLGFTVTPVTATAIGAAEERFSGAASGFNNAVSRVAGLLAIAVMGVIVVQLWQSGLAATAATAAPAVRASLSAVRDRAFVRPAATGMPAAEAAQARTLALDASAAAFRDGMLLASALVALGGVTSALFVRGKGVLIKR
jgi:EmrB/QacA subfamily drug resistance transporter